jgi:hypothetical protein
LCSKGLSDVDAAQRELDEFFGTQNVSSSEHSGFPHAIDRAGLRLNEYSPAAPSLSVDHASTPVAGYGRIQASHLSHVDDAGRATMVDVAQARSQH